MGKKHELIEKYNKNSKQTMDIPKMIQQIKSQQPLQQKLVKRLCHKVQQILVDESNLQPVSSPVNVIGDVHGQFYDVLKIFQLGGHLPQQKYIFVGDFVDRGYNSVQTILLLLCYKLQYPDRIYLLRGNHESRQVSCMYGFHEEVTRKYGNSNVWKYCNDLFDYLPLGAIIDDEIFCVHGGLSPDIHALDQIRQINRKMQIPTQGPFADLMWSDPQEIDTWAHGSRGAGWLFGHKVVDEFNRHNGLKLIARAHQLAQQGYTTWFDNKNLVTVWSAPNYCYRCNNMASIMKVNEQLQHSFEIFGADQRSKQSTHYSKIIPYFL